jgi:hypothetical protein
MEKKTLIVPGIRSDEPQAVVIIMLLKIEYNAIRTQSYILSNLSLKLSYFYVLI